MGSAGKPPALRRGAPEQRQDSARAAPGQRHDILRTTPRERHGSARRVPGQRPGTGRTACGTCRDCIGRRAHTDPAITELRQDGVHSAHRRRLACLGNVWTTFGAVDRCPGATAEHKRITIVACWGGSCHPVPCIGTCLMERCGSSHVLLAVWMGCPNQTGGLQGRPGVSMGGLAGSDSGTGPGWQQSRQN